jgi:hypothetical protein
VKTDRELCGVYIAACAGLVTLLAAMVEPYIPTIASAIRYGDIIAGRHAALSMIMARCYHAGNVFATVDLGGPFGRSQAGLSPADAQLSSRLLSLASTLHQILPEGDWLTRS